MKNAVMNLLHNPVPKYVKNKFSDPSEMIRLFETNLMIKSYGLYFEVKVKFSVLVSG